MSYKIEVLTGEEDWNGNALRFATHDEAHRYGQDLLSRWLVPRGSRVVEVIDPVNYRLPEGGVLQRVTLGEREGEAPDATA